MNDFNEVTAPPPPPEDDTTSQDDRTWGMLAHLSALSGVIIPFGSIIGPLVVWLIKKDEMQFVDDQGKESLNFQITALIAFIVLIVIAIVTFGIGMILLPVFFIAWLILVILAAVKASKGEAHRYPFALRLIK